MARTLVQDAVLRNLETIGDAVRMIPDEYRIKHPLVDWASASGMRNVLAHAYLDIDLEVVWSVVQEHLPAMKVAVQEIAMEFKKEF